MVVVRNAGAPASAHLRQLIHTPLISKAWWRALRGWPLKPAGGQRPLATAACILLGCGGGAGWMGGVPHGHSDAVRQRTPACVGR